MSKPHEITVRRYVCPHCNRGRSTRKSAVAHMARCWRNPANRSCKTCVWFAPADGISDDRCSKGVVVGKPREMAIMEAWKSGSLGDADSSADDSPSPFPLQCKLWEGCDR